MATTITQVENSCAWVVKGRHEQFPKLFGYERMREQPVLGSLVTSYKGQRHTDSTGKMGLGIVVGVLPHPDPLGDRQFVCLVVWNFDPKTVPG